MNEWAYVLGIVLTAVGFFCVGWSWGHESAWRRFKRRFLGAPHE